MYSVLVNHHGIHGRELGCCWAMLGPGSVPVDHAASDYKYMFDTSPY